MKKTHDMKSVCSSTVSYNIKEDLTVSDIEFKSGCSGNLSGISALCEGMRADEIVQRLRGLSCGFKSTSCPDQFARALESDIEELSK